jgi:plastocyanin
MKTSIYRSSLLLAAIALAALVVCAVGCGGDHSSDVQSGATTVDDDSGGGVTHEASIIDYDFTPKSITITVGDTVRWTNNGDEAHTVTSGDPGAADSGALFDSGPIAAGSTYTHQFDAVGDFVYHCEFHPTLMFDAHVTVAE